MARLFAGGPSEQDAMLKDENSAGSEIKEGKKVHSSSEINKDSDEKRKNDAIAKKSSHALSSQNDVKEIHSNQSSESRKFRKVHVKQHNSLMSNIYHDGYICHRTVGEWICTILYLLCIYIFLGILLTVSICTIIYITQEAPVYYGEGTFIGGIPGLGFEPRKRSQNKEQNVFKWNIKEPQSYHFYVQRLRTIMHEYAKKEKIRSKFKLDCQKTINRHADGRPVKYFCKTEVTNKNDIYGYGDCALTEGTNFGYDTATPCVMLRINKLFGYYPESSNFDLYDNWDKNVTNSTTAQNINFTAYEMVKSRDDLLNTTTYCSDNRMLFHCSFLEKNVNATVEQFPKFGYSYCFYPYNQQNGYMQPFVMIRLKNLLPKQRIGIKCIPSASDLKKRSLKLWFEIQ